MAGAVAVPRRPKESLVPPAKSNRGILVRIPQETLVVLRKLAAQLRVNTAGEAVEHLVEQFGKPLLLRMMEEDIKKAKHP